MIAIGYQQTGGIDVLVDIELPTPVATGRDLLVEVKAVSVNPVDTKVRKRDQPEAGGWKVLGWDAAGIVSAVGPEATLFRSGDAVFYAGAIGRPGTNACQNQRDDCSWLSLPRHRRGRPAAAPRHHSGTRRRQHRLTSCRRVDDVNGSGGTQADP